MIFNLDNRNSKIYSNILHNNPIFFISRKKLYDHELNLLII